MTYEEYLKTEAWQEKRKQRLEIDEYKCRFCNSQENLTVHHISYERVGDEDVSFDLITLCWPCHQELHRIIDSEKPRVDALNKQFENEASAVLKAISEKYIDICVLHLAEITFPVVMKHKFKNKPTILKVLNESMGYTAGKWMRKKSPWYNSGSRSIYTEAMKRLPSSKNKTKED